MPDNWTVTISYLIEESRAHKDLCQLITGEGDFRDSATEIKPPYQGRVKRQVRAHRFLVTKSARQTPGARLNREDEVFRHKKQSLVGLLG